jgi:hypothetical protein
MLAHLTISKVHVDFPLTLRSDRLDEKAGSTDIELIIDCETVLVRWEYHVLGSNREKVGVINDQFSPTTRPFSREAYRMIGRPVALASLNAVYHTGSREYLNLRISRIMLL